MTEDVLQDGALAQERRQHPNELERVYAQAQAYADELQQLYAQRNAAEAELARKVEELERSHEQLLAYATDLGALNSLLRATYRQTLEALGRAVDRRDGMTGGHCVRVAEYSRLLGQRIIGPKPQDLQVLEYGALLHDVGKIAVPDAILRKNGPLTDEEWAIMREHPCLGHEILYGIGFLTNSLPIVLHHHERFDGQGYPHGLRGAAIPLGARIFSAADAFDAMTADRHYRQALSLDEAMAELHKNSGTQFDPEVIAVMDELADELYALRTHG
ncbi:MAG: HD-GYP domain-containing protein [Chloroflexi bacterium]|nr:HD-GYP domain-containing protein [Chloroflexota bacterium]